MPQPDDLTQDITDSLETEPSTEEEPQEPREVEEGTEAEHQEADSPPSAVPSDLVEIPGYGHFHPQDLQPIAQAARWAQAHPEDWQKVVSFIEGKAEIPAEEGEDEEDYEYVDPRVSRLEQEVASLRSSLATREGKEIQVNIRRAASDFRRTHQDVSDEDMNALWVHVRDYGTLPTYVDRHGDEVEGTREALEHAWRVLSYDRVSQSSARQVVKDMRDRRRAAAAQGGERSAPRVEPEPQNDRERLNALAADIKEAMEAGS